MGFEAALITFSPSTKMKSADVNSNFNNLNKAGTLSGGTIDDSFYAGKMQTNGGTLGATAASSGQVTFNAQAARDPSGNPYDTYSFCNGAGAGTYNHGYHGTPTWVCPVVDSFGNAEGLGVASFTATTFVLNMTTFFSFHCISSISN